MNGGASHGGPAGGRRFQRYVALGDSSTEGLDDPDGRGGYRGWATRLAEWIAATQGPLLHANLGVRGLLAADVRRQQLEPALAMRPDLATVFAGSNDLFRARFDPGAVGEDVAQMQQALIRSGATVLTFTLPDLTRVMPLGRLLSPRVRGLNEALRAASARTGARLVDFAAHPVGSDARLWSADRFHANAAGHERIARALAHALGLPGADARWSDPLAVEADADLGTRFATELAWAGRFLLAPALQAALGRSAVTSRRPPRPTLEPFQAPPAG